MSFCERNRGDYFAIDTSVLICICTWLPSQVCTGVDIVEVVHLVRAVAQRRVALAVWVETVHLEIQTLQKNILRLSQINAGRVSLFRKHLKTFSSATGTKVLTIFYSLLVQLHSIIASTLSIDAIS